jgi:hypothetical protein
MELKEILEESWIVFNYHNSHGAFPDEDDDDNDKKMTKMIYMKKS